MLKAGNDKVKVVKSLKAGLEVYDTSVQHQYETEEISAIDTLGSRQDFNTVLATMPSYWWPLIRHLPWFAHGPGMLRLLQGMAVNAVARRLAASTIGNGEVEKRDDMLQRLLEGRDEEGKPMLPDEINTEALTLLVAGSDTVSNSSSGIIYYVSRDQRVQDKLQAELNVALGDAEIADYDKVKHLKYLDAVVNEGLRLYTTLGIGLPRVVPEGGLTILGQTFDAGTVLSVPTYTVHRDAAAWGADVEEFRPERWLEGDAKEMQKAFAPFSVGPRACVGRNLAQMEMLVLIATIFHRYSVTLMPGEILETRDATIRKLPRCMIGIKRRDI